MGFEPTKEVTTDDAPANGLPDPTSGDALIQPNDTTTAPSLQPDAAVGLAQPHMEAYAGFDPERHRTGPDGKPVFTPKGRYAKKSRGATSAPAASPGTNAATKGAVGVKVDNLPIAKKFCHLAIGACVRFFGPEWMPEDKAEADDLSTSLAEYFDARGVPQMPPEVVLIVAFSAYAVKRLNHENTQTKIARIWMKVRDWREKLKRK